MDESQTQPPSFLFGDPIFVFFIGFLLIIYFMSIRPQQKKMKALQTMMDDAEKAYDGGLMKKAFGGMVDDSVDESRMGMYSDEEEEIKKQMIDANRMPSVR